MIDQSQKKRDYHRDRRPMSLPLANEFLAGLDWLSLTVSPVYYGLGIEHGNGEPVVVVPGFLGTDLYLGELRNWLLRIGYRAYLSQIGQNANCLNLLTDRLLETVRKAHSDTGRPVHIIGHSLGGIMACSIAARHPELVASIVTLASPIRGVRSHPFILHLADVVRERIYRDCSHGHPTNCYTGDCPCPSVDVIPHGFSSTIPHLAIYTKFDGVVDWKACINNDPITDFEVPGTHVGLVFNPAVYNKLAEWLSFYSFHRRS